jgi:nicotinate (nicotinamide) nucleotide adenylyltransferase
MSTSFRWLLALSLPLAAGVHAEGLVLYGGSFCPPHRTHIAEARLGARAVGATRTILIPTSPGAVQYGPVRRTGAWHAVCSRQRLAMTWLATRGHPELEVSPIEVARPSQGYSTSRTALELAASHPGPVWLLVGADVMASLRTWERLPEVLSRVGLLVNEYPPHELGSLPEYLPPSLGARYRRTGPRRWRHADGPEVRFVKLATGALSSGQVRRAAAAGEDLTPLVPRLVARYIEHHGLFGAAMGGGRGAVE